MRKPYPGLEVISETRDIIFYRHHFRDLIVSLATKEKYGPYLAEKLEQTKDFNIGSIIVKNTPGGVLFKSPRIMTHKTSGTTIKLNSDELYDLYDMLKYETFDKRDLGYYFIRKGVKKMRRARYTKSYCSSFCFYFAIHIKSWPYFPRLIPDVYQRIRKEKLPKKRQSHGKKTISNRYLRNIDNQIRHIENPP